MKKKILLLTTLIYLFIVVYFYLKPGQTTIVIGSDKFMHFAGFFVGGIWLVFLILLRSAKGLIMSFLLFLLVSPPLLEYLQGYSPGRSTDVLDIVANYSGWIVPIVLFAIARGVFSFFDIRLKRGY